MIQLGYLLPKQFLARVAATPEPFADLTLQAAESRGSACYFSKFCNIYAWKTKIVLYFVAVSLFMTPLDVVKIRLQSQDMMRNKCFLYWNGITDHLYPRVNGDPPPQVSQDLG